MIRQREASSLYHMEWQEYEQRFLADAKNRLTEFQVRTCLAYAKRLHLNCLPVIYDVNHLELLIGAEKGILYKISNRQDLFYRTFNIPKKSGGFRQIEEPLPTLKHVQRWILRNILYCIKPSRYVKSYVPGVSLVDAVKFHKGQKTVVRVDIKDFFPSVRRYMVLRQFKEMGYSNELCRILSNICTSNDGLPQGAPTSGYLSNLVLSSIDETIWEYCSTRKIRYTRYSDDLWFSGDFDVSELLKHVYGSLCQKGFLVAKEKTRVMRSSTRQLVLGLVVNSGLKVKREYKRNLRQVSYYVAKHGLQDHLRKTENYKNDAKEHYVGKANYVLSVESNQRDALAFKGRL